MSILKHIYEERKKEVQTYFDFLKAIETSAQSGVPCLTSNNNSTIPISAEQVQMLRSSYFLLLYNITEMLMTSFIEQASSIIISNHYKPRELPEQFYRLWLSCMLKIKELNISSENRIDLAKELHSAIESNSDIINFTIKKPNSGNWAIEEIQNFIKKLNIPVNIPCTTYKIVHRPILNDKPVLEAVRDIRNKLAHGEKSFVECSDGMENSRLAEITHIQLSYLDALANELDNFLNNLRNKILH